VSVFGEFDALAANDEGFRLLKQGRVDEGLALLADSARAGVPWALATHSWQHLIRDNPREALDLAQTALPACRAWIESIYDDPDLVESANYQLINARSNLALCGLALGYPPAEALAVWEEGIGVGHAESAFYPALVAYRSGNSIAARGAASAIPSSVLAGLRVSFRDDARGAAPWFVEWCGDGLAVLELIGFESPSVDRLDRRRLLGLTSLQDSADLTADDWEALGLVHQADRAKTEQALRSLSYASTAVSYPARAELGTLLIDTGNCLSPRYREGWELLLDGLGAPYREVVAMVAWNISAELRRHGDSVSASEFGELALDLGDGTALAHCIREATEAGDMERARQLAERAEGQGSGSPAATAVRSVAALDASLNAGSDVREWFARAQGAITAHAVAAVTPIYAWRGDYNVDVASAAIAVDHFDDCDLNCYFDSVPGDCDNCGRTSDTFLYAASGGGDGGYPAFELYSPDGVVLGVFSAFMDVMAEKSAVGAVADLGDWLDSSAPLFLGTINSAGRIVLGDAAMSTDGRDVAVDFEVAPGSYAVVCWVGAGPSGGELLPVALAAGTGALGDVLGRQGLRLPREERDRLIRSMWGAPDRTVFALMVDIRPQVLARNWEALKDSDQSRADAYALQWAERDDAQDVQATVASYYGCGSHDALQLLETRGWLEPNLPWWRPEMARDPQDVWGRVLAARQPVLPPTREACRDVVWVRRAAARHPNLPADDAAALSRDPDLRVRVNIAGNAATPSGILGVMAGSPDDPVAAAAASNENCPPEALARLAYAGRCAAAVARNPRTSIEALEALADNPSAYVRSCVASTEGISGSTLLRMAGDPDASVRAAVAANPDIDADAARQLCHDDDEWVRAALAGNPQVTADVVADLTVDRSETVRDAARANPRCPASSRGPEPTPGAGLPPRHAGGLGSGSGLGLGLGTGKGLSESKGLGSSPLLSFCSACGSALVQGGRFCPGCGAPTSP